MILTFNYSVKNVQLIDILMILLLFLFNTNDQSPLRNSVLLSPSIRNTYAYSWKSSVIIISQCLIVNYSSQTELFK